MPHFSIAIKNLTEVSHLTLDERPGGRLEGLDFEIDCKDGTISTVVSGYFEEDAFTQELLDETVAEINQMAKAFRGA